MTTFNRISRRGVLSAVVGVTVAGLTASAVQAQETFPSKPIEVVIHASYGGGTDVTARMMMIRSRRELKTDMQVVAKEAGSGQEAHAYALSKPKDGYTVLAFTQTHLYTIAQGKSPITIDDIQGVARAMDDPIFVTVGASGPYKTMADLVNASKEKALNWGIASIGNTEHIALATLAKKAGFKFKVVPFGSGGQMVQALMSGAIDATLPNVSEGGPQVEDGTFRALAVLAEKRLAGFPDVPTSHELGYPVNASTTRGYFVLKGTPMDRVEILSKAMNKAMKHEVFANYLKSAGLDPATSPAPYDVWDKQIKEEYVVAKEALQELGIIK